MIPHAVLAKLPPAREAARRAVRNRDWTARIPYSEPSRLDENPGPVGKPILWYTFELQKWGNRDGLTIWTWRFPEGPDSRNG